MERRRGTTEEGRQEDRKDNNRETGIQMDGGDQPFLAMESIERFPEWSVRKLIPMPPESLCFWSEVPQHSIPLNKKILARLD
eukprot:746904-Hanusia_phi.AAC.1